MTDPTGPEAPLDAIKARVEAATPGPWWAENLASPTMDGSSERGPTWKVKYGLPGGRLNSGPGHDKETAAFIAHARSDVPWLIEQLEEARAERDALLDHEFAELADLRAQLASLTVRVEGAKAIHEAVDIGEDRMVCLDCEKASPCPTLRALADPAEGRPMGGVPPTHGIEGVTAADVEDLLREVGRADPAEGQSGV